MFKYYAWERFDHAMRQFITTNEPLQSRIASLSRGTGHLQRQDFPDDATWENYQDLQGKLIKATSSEISDEEASQILQSSLGLYTELTKETWRKE